MLKIAPDAFNPYCDAEKKMLDQLLTYPLDIVLQKAKDILSTDLYYGYLETLISAMEASEDGATISSNTKTPG